MAARQKMSLPFATCAALFPVFLMGTWLTQAVTADDSEFEAAVAPILVKRCLECHNATEAAGELVLISNDAMQRGGASGPVVVPGEPSESYLLDQITSGEMPPEKNGKRQLLPQSEIDQLTAWVRNGARWPQGRELNQYEATSDVRGGRDWWSIQPPRQPEIPVVATTDRVANAVDAFVLDRLEQKGMTLAPPADKRTLIRRAYFDVIGLPPTYDEIEAFAADTSPGAYENLVDRLLESPQYGERWARFWLDLARYAETCGYERDQTKPNVWKYRDWVIRSLNEDKPYDRFVQEQLAGDELPDRSEETVIATAFLRVGTWNDEPNDPFEYKFERLDDMIHATSTAFLGVTVKCARCHDHKFDPIPQVDYYRLASIFWAGFIEPGDRALLGGPSAEALGEDVFGWTDATRDPAPLHLLIRGNPRQPGPVVEPGFLSMIPTLDHPLAPPAEGSTTSQRRLQLARWITDPGNPLTARVLVNRLWQHHFGAGIVRTPNNFGFTGDLPTHPDLLDFLADALVRNEWRMKPLHRLLMLSSTYRQASQHPEQEHWEQSDSSNRLWWRFNRRRLEAEAIRDTMLCVSGLLDARMGGPSFHPRISPNALEGLSRKDDAWEESPLEDRRRRSVYMFTKRALLPPLMTAFDFCDTTQPCGKRNVTTVPTQALALLNNAFVHEMSDALAQRVVRESSNDLGHRVNRAWRLALGRFPSSHEREAARAHLDEQTQLFSDTRASAPEDTTPEYLALVSLCHVLLNTNEFVYVD